MSGLTRDELILDGRKNGGGGGGEEESTRLDLIIPGKAK